MQTILENCGASRQKQPVWSRSGLTAALLRHFSEEVRNAVSLCLAWSRLGSALSFLYPRPVVCAPGGIAPACPRFLDRVLGRHRLRGPGDDGTAVRSHSAPPLRHRAVGRRRHLPLSPPDVADRSWSGAGTPDHSVYRPAGAARAAQLLHGALARTLCRPVDVLAHHFGRNGLVAAEVKHPVRDMAPHTHRACSPRSRGRCGTYGWLEFLSGRSLEASAVDLLRPLLDRPA